MDEDTCSACGGELSDSTLIWGCRQYERVIHCEGATRDDVEVGLSNVVKEYCSRACAESDRKNWLESEGVRATTYPGTGHDERCSKCGKPVNLGKRPAKSPSP